VRNYLKQKLYFSETKYGITKICNNGLTSKYIIIKCKYGEELQVNIVFN